MKLFKIGFKDGKIRLNNNNNLMIQKVTKDKIYKESPQDK